MEENKEKPTLSILNDMLVGQTLSFPAEKLNSVKSMCSTFGFQWNKKFSTSMNRANRTIEVTRVQ